MEYFSNKMDNKPVKGEYLEVLLRSPQTVFSTKDAALLWGESDEAIITRRLNKYAHSGKLIRVRRGFYTKDDKYNRLELATRIYTPAYVSFETVLTREGVNFQYYSSIFVASYLNREIQIEGQAITYVRMKDFVLRDITGVIQTDGYALATKERAFLDRLYVSKDYHFDNFNTLDWDRIMTILPIYHNQRLSKAVDEYFTRQQRDEVV